MPDKPHLYIVGAGGLGREVLAWIHDIPQDEWDWELKGFLNSIPTALDGMEVGFPIVSDPLDFTFTGRELVICAIGDPAGRLKLSRTLARRGAGFLTLRQPSALLSPSAEIAPGCLFATDALVSAGARIGSYTVVLGSSSIGVDAVIEEGVTISGYCAVGRGAVIGEGAFLGSHAIVAQGTKVGKGARIGARTVVSGEVPDGATYFGVPGRMIAGF